MNQKIIWVGPRESDLLYSGLDIFRSITFNGSNQDGNTAFTSEAGVRIDHITEGKKWNLMNFLHKELQPFLADPNVRFMFYNPMQSYRLGNDAARQTLCINSLELTNFFQNKANMRTFAQECIPVVPYIHFKGRALPEVRFGSLENCGYILQLPYSSAGTGTFHLSPEECRAYVADGAETTEYILSPYLEHAVPINVHMVIFDQDCVVFPPSYQLVSHQGSAFSYIGGDFHTGLSERQYTLIMRSAESLGEKMRLSGYRGVCGIDFMLTEKALYFLEVNVRFQASTFLANKLLWKEGRPSLHQLNQMAFEHAGPPMESFSRFQNPESFFSVNGDRLPPWLEKKAENLTNEFDIIWDGLSDKMELAPEAYLCRITTEKNLCWISPDFQLRIAPNVQRDTKSWRNKIQSMDPLSLKIGLLTQGVRISEDAVREMERSGSIRSGVFQSVDLTFPGGLIINSPYCSRFSGLSPYCVEWDGHSFFLTYENAFISPVSLAPADPNRDRTAAGGTRFRNAVFLATDRLRVHHEFRCRFKEEGIGCRFCNVRVKNGCFSIEDVCEAIDFYLEHVPFRHFLIGGGSGKEKEESDRILTLTRHIRSRTDKPIYAMCLPPEDTSVLSDYHRAGINEIGFNLELFDRGIAAEIMPGKGKIPLLQYERAYREAVRLWGGQGAVRSLMVLGLEPLPSFYRGIEWLCRLGVMPIVSIFRPMDNIELNCALPHGNEELSEIFEHGTQIAAQYGLTLGPDCPDCQNNTLSLPYSHFLGSKS